MIDTVMYNILSEKIATLELKLKKLIDERQRELNKVKEIKKEDLTFAEALQLLQNGEVQKISCWHRDDIYIYKILISMDGSVSEYFRCHTINGKNVIWIPNSYEMLEAKWRVIGGDKA